MSHINIRVHLVLAAGQDAPHIGEEIRPLLVNKIFRHASESGLEIDAIDGWVDHLHFLVRFGEDRSVGEVARTLMEISAFWMNERARGGVFEWEKEYYAVSVSESLAGELKRYINRQRIHHTVTPFEQEMLSLRRMSALSV